MYILYQELAHCVMQQAQSNAQNHIWHVCKRGPFPPHYQEIYYVTYVLQWWKLSHKIILTHPVSSQTYLQLNFFAKLSLSYVFTNAQNSYDLKHAE